MEVFKEYKDVTTNESDLRDLHGLSICKFICLINYSSTAV